MRRICIAIETDDDQEAEKARAAAAKAAGEVASVYRSWVVSSGYSQPSKADTVEGIAEVMKSVAAEDLPIVVAVSSDVSPQGVVIHWPVPPEYFPDDLTFGLPHETKAFVVGHQALEDMVREKAEAAGVRVLN